MCWSIQERIRNSLLHPMSGRCMLVVRRKRGKLILSEVLEELTDSGKYTGSRFVLELDISGYLPFDLYDEGDIWMLYRPDNYLGKEGSERLRPKKPLSISEERTTKKVFAQRARWMYSILEMRNGTVPIADRKWIGGISLPWVLWVD